MNQYKIIYPFTTLPYNCPSLEKATNKAFRKLCDKQDTDNGIFWIMDLNKNLIYRFVGYVDNNLPRFVYLVTS